MHIEKLKLTNFRKFQDLEINFNKGLNLFVGPNDSGKTTIIDALKLVLGTASNDYFKIQHSDFYNNTNIFKIEVFLTGFTDFQCSQLLDWGGLNDNGDFCLKVIFSSSKTSNGFHSTVKAGTYEEDDGGSYLEPIVKEYIKSVYLKPLRNAEIELRAGRNSRFSQILLSHPDIQEDASKLEGEFQKFTDDILVPHFESKGIKDNINSIFEKLLEKHKGLKGEITIESSNIYEIVKTLSLLVEESKNKKPGLGTSNLLLIASELLLLDKLKGNKYGCALIEEIEAHIHPQGQLRLINFLQKEAKDLQLFLTSHSPNIASKLSIKDIFIFRDDKIFPMSESYTGLSNSDYKHLRRFLDVTKANLFFAKGLIFVEGIAEALIVPEIAKILGYNLDSYGVSIINVNGLSFNRYLNAFVREKGDDFDIKISVITDRDGRIELTDKKNKSDFENTINTESESDFYQKYVYIEGQEYMGNKNIKKYYNLISTLEFDMGLSCLSNSLIKARYNLYEEKKEEDFVSEISDTNKFKQALKLYKKIENKKGETAQELSDILCNLSKIEQEELKSKIENDKYLKYIVEAIKNVTE